MATTKEAALSSLVTKFGTKDWFHSVSIEPQFGRDLVVYAKHLSHQILKAIPEKVDEHRVIVHFAAYKETNLANFTGEPIVLIPILDEELLSEDVEVEDISAQIQALKKVCGKESLSAIFHEIHDKDNAMTNSSEEFPEIRDQLEILYNELGFDIVFEEIEK